MNKYKYFENVKENAYFTEAPCQFCGATENCLDGAFFERDDIESICLNCFEKKQVEVDVPDYIRNNIKNDSEKKFGELRFTPPVPWIQNNDWPVCCDDYMVFIGEWEQDDFIKASENNDGKALLKKLLHKDLIELVENWDALWDDIGYETAAFVFKCPYCGKIVVICQDY